MKWEILILTQPSRQHFLVQLYWLLNPQLKGKDVSVTTALFDPALTLGANREKMRQAATGDYISFLDDDDLVAANFVDRIFPLLDGADQIGFNVKCFSDKAELGTAFHSLQHGRWYQTVNGRLGGIPGGYYRDISHINPMRRELALRCPMAGGIGEDCRWANDIRALGIVKTEHYIDELLYFYLWRGNKNDTKDAMDPWRLAFIERLQPPAENGKI